MAVDAATLDPDHNQRDAQSAEVETTWKGRLAWTVPTKVLRTTGAQRLDRDLYELGRLRVLTSAPRSSGGRTRILFDPPAAESQGGFLKLDRTEGQRIHFVRRAPLA